jgi:hypothetical protein
MDGRKESVQRKEEIFLGVVNEIEISLVVLNEIVLH